jgi:D-alanyl-D-alanine carboxypeptidase
VFSAAATTTPPRTMNTKISRFLAVAFTVVFAVAVGASSDALAAKKKPPAKKASGYSSIVIDAATGRVLQEDNADAQRYPASLTKMMTLYMIFEAIDAGKIKLGTQLNVSKHAANMSPTKLGLEAGDQIAVRDVILGLVTRSANDAAAVAAEALGGTEENFGDMMTQRARRLGMANTTFQNASGLPDPGQITTARDIARLSRALIRDFPHHYGYFSTSEFMYAGRRITNHNRLMNWYEGADGIKTGFIRASGFNLAASAVRENRRLIGVVLGGPSPGARDVYMGKLLDAAFAGGAALPEIREASAPVPAPRVARAEKPAATTLVQEAKNTKVEPKLRLRDVRGPQLAAVTTRADDSANTGSSDASWAIQVGAFHRADAARRAAQAATTMAPDALREAGVNISTLDRKKNTIHRARLVGLTEAQGRDACKVLQRQKHDCQVLSPADLRGSLRVAN